MSSTSTGSLQRCSLADPVKFYLDTTITSQLEEERGFGFTCSRRVCKAWTKACLNQGMGMEMGIPKPLDSLVNELLNLFLICKLAMEEFSVVVIVIYKLLCVIYSI